MSILGRFPKQPSEILDYQVDYSEWAADRTDTPVSFVVTAETGITVTASSRSGWIVTVVLSGGTSGTKYKITVRLTTSSGVVREADFIVSVKES